MQLHTHRACFQAYLYINVSLIQMIKASNTVWTYMWSVPLGLHAWHRGKALNLAVIGGGVAVAAMGAVEGSPVGMVSEYRAPPRL